MSRGKVTIYDKGSSREKSNSYGEYVARAGELRLTG